MISFKCLLIAGLVLSCTTFNMNAMIITPNQNAQLTISFTAANIILNKYTRFINVSEIKAFYRKYKGKKSNIPYSDIDEFLKQHPDAVAQCEQYEKDKIDKQTPTTEDKAKVAAATHSIIKKANLFITPTLLVGFVNYIFNETNIILGIPGLLCGVIFYGTEELILHAYNKYVAKAEPKAKK